MIVTFFLFVTSAFTCSIIVTNWLDIRGSLAVLLSWRSNARRLPSTKLGDVLYPMAFSESKRHSREIGGIHGGSARARAAELQRTRTQIPVLCFNFARGQNTKMRRCGRQVPGLSFQSLAANHVHDRVTFRTLD